MKFKASVFTLNTKDQVKFEKQMTGTIKKDELNAKNLAAGFAREIWKAKTLQDEWKKAGGTERVLGLAKGARLVFYMEIDGKQFMNTEVTDTTKLAVTIGDKTLDRLQRFLELFFEYTLEEQKEEKAVFSLN